MKNGVSRKLNVFEWYSVVTLISFVRNAQGTESSVCDPQIDLPPAFLSYEMHVSPNWTI